MGGERLSELVNGRAKWAAYAGVAALVGAALGILGWTQATKREARLEGASDATLQQRMGYIEQEQERRRHYIESIPLLTQQVQQLVESQKELTGEVGYNTQVMVEMLKAIGYKTPPRREQR